VDKKNVRGSAPGVKISISIFANRLTVAKSARPPRVGHVCRNSKKKKKQQKKQKKKKKKAPHRPAVQSPMPTTFHLRRPVRFGGRRVLRRPQKTSSSTGQFPAGANRQTAPLPDRRRLEGQSPPRRQGRPIGTPAPTIFSIAFCEIGGGGAIVGAGSVVDDEKTPSASPRRRQPGRVSAARK